MQTAIYYGIKHFGYLACYIPKNRIYTMLYTMLYSIRYILKRVLGLLSRRFFWLYRPFFGYIPPSIAKKGGMFLKRRWYVTKVVYSLIGIYDIPEPGGLGRAGCQGLEAPAPPASLSLGLDWIVTSRMSRLDWLQARLRA